MSKTILIFLFRFKFQTYKMRTPSKILLGTTIILLAPVLYFTLTIGEGYAPYLIPLVILSVSVYVLSPQIDWWWYIQFPKAPNPSVVSYFSKNFTGFNQLSPNTQRDILNKFHLLEMSKNFISKGEDDKIPDGLKLVVLASLLECTYKRKDFQLKDYENIVLYAHPFPSPKWPQQLHLSEMEVEDGVFIFSLPAVLEGLKRPRQFFPVSTYEFCKAVLKSSNLPLKTTDTEEVHYLIQQVLGYNFKQIADYINLPLEEINIEAVLLVLAVRFPHELQLLSSEIANWGQVVLSLEKTN
jgi:hypothetical protein